MQAKIAGDGSAIIFCGVSDWSQSRGVLPITQVLSEAGCDFSGWTITEVTGISFDGKTLCGNGLNPQGQREAWHATVPSPGAGGLLVLGALGAIRGGRRRPISAALPSVRCPRRSPDPGVCSTTASTRRCMARA